MNISELEKLAELHQNGALTADEFAQAKAKLLSTDSKDSDKNSLGRAAHRGVTVITVFVALAIVLVLAFFFGFFLPTWNKQQAAFDQGHEDFNARWNSMSQRLENNTLTSPGQTNNDGLAAKQ